MDRTNKTRQDLQKKYKENKNQISKGKNHAENDFFTDTLRIPADVSQGDFRMTITGDKRIWVENYRNILEYSDHQILLQGNRNRLSIEGECLCIDYYTKEDMMVKGTIRAVRLAGLRDEQNGKRGGTI